FLGLFAVLFGWVSAGFWTAMMGFVQLATRPDRFTLSRSLASGAPETLDARARTAIVMPICNEDVARVFAGLRATFMSLQETGLGRRFDFFVLSDTTDPDVRVAEVDAWSSACNELGAFDRIFYRWRQHRIKRKSGNLADFCRRWGKRYRYMVVLDADSVMSGDCLTTLVRLMEANPNAGIIQTAPCAIGRDTLHARAQQFATRVYGPLFVAGLHFWQLGESHYWGHNAIIRVAPFIEHCALRRLPGRGPFSGEILSHDFIEAALMRRAGWAVWMAHDLPGSYEMVPPNLLDELQRDQRWCAGNLMNLRLLFLPGLAPPHRSLLIIGAMAYASGALWLALLVLTTALLAVQAFHVHQYFVTPHQLAPIWPEWHPDWALKLLGMTAALLFLPKVLAAFAAATRGARAYGGTRGLIGSTLSECLLSALLAPIRMWFHARFVINAVCGRRVAWRSPTREDAQTTWREAVARHGSQTALGLAWAAIVYLLDPAFIWWLAPIFAPWILSIPLSVCTSRASWGRALRAVGVFLTPEEVHPPQEAVRAMAAEPRHLPTFLDAVTEPKVHALVVSTLRPRATAAMTLEADRLTARALAAGPAEWNRMERMRLLNNPLALARLHRIVWTRAGAEWRWSALAPARAAPAVSRRRPYRYRPGRQTALLSS
ncbi:MAG TPA: glucans biosynthesis glucosyltransferase MdoH, partial [Casimicrobiaceae bacterium]|nr:glucans biosynthesis glucosyltransferase MdoH [Casimicrobiaceae bacterium]